MSVIGIDARFYHEAGPGRYLKNIISHLEKLDSKNTYLIFLKKKGFDLYRPKSERFKKILANYSWYSFEEQTLFLLKLLRFRLDLLYVPHFNIPLFYPFKIVTAIADIIMHTFSTEEGTTLPRFYYRFKKWVYFLVVFLALVKSTRVLVPSQATKKDLVENYPFINGDKYVVAYEGVDPDLKDSGLNSKSVLKKYGIMEPFILYVGSMYEHKNLKRLFEAFEILREDFGYKGQLVLVGKNDLFAKRLFELAQKRSMGEFVVFPGRGGYVTDEEATSLRKEAEVYVFPSLKEGFSLTPLESMIHDTPCVVSDIPCHREVYGDSVLYFDPFNPYDIAKKVNMVLSDTKLKQSFIDKGRRLMGKYNWTNTASQTLNVFNEALKDS